MSNSPLNGRKLAPRMAYIDGGLAAILLQGAAGAVLAGLLYVKIYWQKVKTFFVRGESGSGAPSAAGSGSDPKQTD